jgi:cation transport ATPase
VRLAHESGFVTREIIGRFNSAHSLSALGRHDEARAGLIACLEPARRTVRALVPGICESLAECALATGDRAAAVSWFREGSGIAHSMGNIPATKAMLERLAELSAGC